MAAIPKMEGKMECDSIWDKSCCKFFPADVNYANDQNMQTWNVRFNLKQFFFAKIFEFGVDV